MKITLGRLIYETRDPILLIDGLNGVIRPIKPDYDIEPPFPVFVLNKDDLIQLRNLIDKELDSANKDI